MDENTVKNALKGGAVTGGGFLLVVAILLLIGGPLLVIAAWKLGYITFELTVVVLLLFAIYVGGS